MKRTLYLVLVLVMLLSLAGSASAASTPSWWDNPGGLYTTWHRAVRMGTVANSQPLLPTIKSVSVDIPNNLNLNNISIIWVQLEYTPHGPIDILNQSILPYIEWTYNGTCPAALVDPFPGGAQFSPSRIVPQGDFVAHNTNPVTNKLYTDGDQYSFVLLAQPKCERVTFSFVVGPNSSIDYHAEVQSVCQTPNAVNLSGFRAVSSMPVVGLVGLPVLTVGLAGGLVWLRRRRVAK